MKNITIKNVPDYVDETRLLERIAGLIQSEVNRNVENDSVVLAKKANAQVEIDSFKTANSVREGRL